ncbi:hypothetical protein [Bordetella tumulicola]|uniref:hypothetical protein n=1 Tax=Bordetella tumulicola TaxID=1649133 RepID=UPI0039F02FC3
MQVADKAEGRVSAAGKGLARTLPQRFLPQHGTDAATWAVTARRSDGPTHPSNNTGKTESYCVRHT